MPNRRLLGVGLNSRAAGGCGGEPAMGDAALEAAGDGGAEAAGERRGTGAWEWAGDEGTCGLESKRRGDKSGGVEATEGVRAVGRKAGSRAPRV